jgi:hypothetical protein
MKRTKMKTMGHTRGTSEPRRRDRATHPASPPMPKMKMKMIMMRAKTKMRMTTKRRTMNW